MCKAVILISFSLAVLLTGSPSLPEVGGSPTEELPEVIAADFLERHGFIRFAELDSQTAVALRNLPENLPMGWPANRPRHYAQAPIGGQTFFDGKPVQPADRASLNLVFDMENSFAMIPPGSKIGVRRDSKGRVIWDYPIGTMTAHLLLRRSQPAIVYELRLVRKTSGGHWEFASYSPADLTSQDPSSELVRNRYDGLPLVRFPVTLGNGRTVDVQMKRVNLKSCQGCHTTNSTADYQYFKYRTDGSLDFPASVKNTGSCGFVANNPAMQNWEKTYREKYGESPFVNLEEL